MHKNNQPTPHAAAVIAAAGSGRRMNSGCNKQFIMLDGMPVLARTLMQFQKAELIDKIIIVAKEDEILTVHDLVREFNITKVTDIVPGGAERRDSVFCGLKFAEVSDVTAIHDGARPFVSVEKINESILAANEYGAAALGVPVKDTVKAVNAENIVTQTPDRDTLRLIQTPQSFRTELILKAYAHAQQTGFSGTDDCSVAENMNIPVKIIGGEYTNIKITTPEDIPFAKAILSHIGDNI